MFENLDYNKKSVLSNWLGVDDAETKPDYYYGYAIIGVYVRQLTYLMGKLGEGWEKDIRMEYECITLGCNLTKDSFILRLEELCREIEVYIDYNDGKINLKDFPDGIKLAGTTTILCGNTIMYWGLRS